MLRRYSVFYPKKSPDALRWGMIGLGNMAEVFASALDDDKDSEIVAVASRSISKATAFASKHGHAKAYGSYDEMLKDSSLQLDVVYIATPPKYHAGHIRQCLEAGQNVLCEKPITTSSNELVPLIALAKEKGLFLMEGMWMKLLPTFQQARKWIIEGNIGQPRLIKADFYKRERIRPELTIFNSAEGGGVLSDYGVYAIAFAEAFLGMPEIILSHSLLSSYKIDSDWQIYLERNEIQAYINLSSDFASSSKAVIVGDDGSIEFNSQFNRTNKVSLYSKDGSLIEEKQYTYCSEGFEYEIAHLRGILKRVEKESDIVTLQDSLNVINICEHLHGKK